jgi:hypothetical protein
MRTIYEANDGSHFDSSEECQQHDLQTKLSKYKNYKELHENVYIHCCIHIGKHPGNNTELFTTAAFIIDNIELLSLMITADLKPIVKSGEFTAGQTILVRDYESEEWSKRVFIRYDNYYGFPYLCEHSEYGKSQSVSWKYAKALSN